MMNPSIYSDFLSLSLLLSGAESYRSQTVDDPGDYMAKNHHNLLFLQFLRDIMNDLSKV